MDNIELTDHKRCSLRSIECEGYEDLSYRPLQPFGESCTASRDVSNFVRPSNPSPYNHSADDEIQNHKRLTNFDVLCSSNSIAAWLTQSPSPFQTPEEQHGLRIWLEIIPSMSRFHDDLMYWTVNVPTLSWSYDPVRYAQTAVALLFDSLRRKNGFRESVFAEKKAIFYVNKSIRSTLSGSFPPEVPIVLATLFWLFETLSGHWLSGMQHLAGGYRIAQTSGKICNLEPTIPSYVKSRVDNYPEAINPLAILGLSPYQRMRQFQARKRYAKSIMVIALDEIKHLQQKVRIIPPSLFRCRAKKILQTQDKELNRIIKYWPMRGTILPLKSEDEDFVTSQERINQHSPFAPVLRKFEDTLFDRDQHHLSRFEVAFGSTLHYFTWLAASELLEDRQCMFDLWTGQR